VKVNTEVTIEESFNIKVEANGEVFLIPVQAFVNFMGNLLGRCDMETLSKEATYMKDFIEQEFENEHGSIEEYKDMMSVADSLDRFVDEIREYEIRPTVITTRK
jgi:hypothetical protein